MSNVASSIPSIQNILSTPSHSRPQAQTQYQGKTSGSPSTTPADASEDVELDEGNRRAKKRQKVNHGESGLGCYRYPTKTQGLILMCSLCVLPTLG